MAAYELAESGVAHGLGSPNRSSPESAHGLIHLHVLRRSAWYLIGGGSAAPIVRGAARYTVVAPVMLWGVAPPASLGMPKNADTCSILKRPEHSF